jgi:hypothetical protein
MNYFMISILKKTKIHFKNCLKLGIKECNPEILFIWSLSEYNKKEKLKFAVLRW